MLKFAIQPFSQTLGNKSIGVSFQLYGADIAIDNELKPLLMEINKGPDLSAKDERDKTLKLKLCYDMLNSVNLLPDNNNEFITVFEQININEKIVNIDNYTKLLNIV